MEIFKQILRIIIYCTVYVFPKLLDYGRIHRIIMKLIGWKVVDGPPFYHIHVPKVFLNEKICKICVNYAYDHTFGDDYSCLLKYVPEELRTKEVCKIAMLTGDIHTINYVPMEFKTREFLEYVIINGSSSIRSIKTELTQELCDFAFDNCMVKFLHSIPMKYRTKRMCKITLELKYFDMNLCYTYDNIYDIFPNRVLKELLIDDWTYIQYIPNKLLTDEDMILCVQSILRLPR